MPRMPRPSSFGRIAAGAGLVMLALLGTACAWSPFDRALASVTPYRVDVMQGNVITRELAERVKPGMSREQVRDVLGSPLLTSPFHGDRWDYVFTMRRQGVEPQRRSVVALFKGDALERLEAPDLPSEKEFVSSIRNARSSGPEPVLELSDDQRRALPLPVKGETSAIAPPQGAVRPYPPLESK